MKYKFPGFLILFFIFYSTTYAFQAEFVLNTITRNYNQQHVRLELRFDFENETVYGTATLRISPLKDNFNELVLHSKITKISEVRLAGDKLNFIQKNDQLFIRLNRGYRKNETIEIVIKYFSQPPKGLFFFFPTENNPEIPFQIWSQGQGEDNRCWFPCFDLPGDRLSAEIIATVPERFTVISNGRLESVKSNPKRKEKIWSWKMDYEQVSYLISIVVGEYSTVSDTVRGIPLNYHLPVAYKDADTDLIFGQTPEIFKFFCDYVGPYPFEKYDQTPVHDFRYGGMENASATTLNKRIFHDERAIPNYSPIMLIAHEFAHQWFGDCLTNKTWPHFWLHEGFATYLTDLFFEYQFGRDEFLFRRLDQNREYFETRSSIPVEKINPAQEPFTPVDFHGLLAYNRGSAILHMLRFQVGDKIFQTVLQRYFQQYRFKDVVSEDFRQVLEEVSGQNFQQFFQQWVYGAGHPHFEVSWQWDENLKQVSLVVKQTQSEAPAMGVFQMKIPVEIVAGQQRFKETLSITQREHTFYFTLPQKPNIVGFNRYLWDLLEIAFKKSFEELAWQVLFDDDLTGRYSAAEQLANFPDTGVEVLSEVLKNEPHYSVRIAAVKSLVKIRSLESLAILKAAAQDSDARVREEVMKALGGFEAENVTRVLLHTLSVEENDYVRAAALASLGKVKAENAFQMLSESLKEDSHNNVIRCGAFTGFKELADSRALPLAQEFIRYKYSSGGMHLLEKSILTFAESLADSHRAEVLPVLLEGVRNPFFKTYPNAGAILRKLNAGEAVPELKKIQKATRKQVHKKYVEDLIKALESQGK